MKPYDALVISTEIQGLMLNKIEDLSFALLTWNDLDKASYSNYAFTDKILSAEEIEAIEKRFMALDRMPAIYFEDDKRFDPLVKDLTAQGYTKQVNDAWLFWNDLKEIAGDFSCIKPVENEKDLEVFLQTSDLCFGANDPQNHYGGLGAVIDVLRDSWKLHHKEGIVEYVIAYKGDKPVAIAGLFHHKGYGYICDVGSLPEVRGQGFGKLVTLYCIKRSKEYGNTEHFLATEVGTHPEEFYTRIGFETRFKGLCYVKEAKEGK